MKQANMSCCSRISSKKKVNKAYRIRRIRYRQLVHNSEDSAVSNIVTSIMMLGIFLSILAMIFTVYIPSWAKTGEVNHMESVANSFFELKSTIDKQIADDDSIGSSLSTRIQLGAEGGAIMGIGRTSGSLEFKTTGFSIIITNSNDTNDLYGRATGKISFKSENVYYANQYFTYEIGLLFTNKYVKQVLKFHRVMVQLQVFPAIHINF